MVVQFIVFLTLSTLICRNTDISKYFSESLGIRDNGSVLYLRGMYLEYAYQKKNKNKKKKKKKKTGVFEHALSKLPKKDGRFRQLP